MPIQNFQERFTITADMETYFTKQDHTLASRKAEMNNTWSGQN